MSKPGVKHKFTTSSLFGWWFFDFAYSIPTVIGGIYFTKWFTENLKANSELLNFLFVVSAILIMLTGKLIGKRIDLNGYKFWIILSSIFSFFSIFLLYVGSQFLPKSFLIILSFILFIIFLFGYQIGRICHNVYLRKIIPEKLQSKMSGYGVAANWAGSIFGIVLSVPIVTSYSEVQGREFTFLMASVAFGIIIPFALMFMFKSKENEEFKIINSEGDEKNIFRSLFTSLGVYLIVYFLLYDVMTIVQRNLPPFLSQVFKMSDKIQAIAFLMILFFAMVGGVIAAKTIKYSNSSFWLRLCAFSLGVSIILITLNNEIALWISFLTAGISYGILESAIRVNFMGTFSPEYAGENFGVLAIVERTSGVVAPILWIISFSLFMDETRSYIISMLVMSGLSFLAFLLLLLSKKIKLSSNTKTNL